MMGKITISHHLMKFYFRLNRYKKDTFEVSFLLIPAALSFTAINTFSREKPYGCVFHKPAVEKAYYTKKQPVFCSKCRKAIRMLES